MSYRGSYEMTITAIAAPLGLHASPYSESCGNPHSPLYAAGMVKRVLRGIQEMRLHLGEVFAGVEGGEHAVFTRRGKPVAVLVPIEWYRGAAKAVKDPTEF
jgi:prevent-host-death family protein